MWLVNYPHSLDILNSLQSGSSLNHGLMILQDPGLFSLPGTLSCFTRNYFYYFLIEKLDDGLKVTQQVRGRAGLEPVV